MSHGIIGRKPTETHGRAKTTEQIITVRNRQASESLSADIPTLGEQLFLLDLDSFAANVGVSNSDVPNAVIFSPDLLGDPARRSMLPQYALLGNTIPTDEEELASGVDRRLFLNTNIPWSTFICGVQGSGKSHTLSCLIENSLIPCRSLGVLKRPLSALVLHFGQYTSRLSFRPCEAAFLAYPSVEFEGQGSVRPVNVLVSPSNYRNLNRLYNNIPGVKVQPLKLQPKYLNVSSMLALMSVNTSQSPPLYMIQVTQILRDMACKAGGDFDFIDFKRRLRDAGFTSMQRHPLGQRMMLLESFLDLDNTSSCFDFQSGSVTIVDLSCPFVDENTACVLFNICVWIYLEGLGSETGKIIAVDEAHKYLTNTPAAEVLTNSLLTAIRQQRHYGARVIVATQEPTVSPRLVELCPMTIVHRFTSPHWFEVLRKYIPTPKNEEEAAQLFNSITLLRVGEALLFAPSGIVTDLETEDLKKLGSRLVRAKVRKRLTWDGGKSIVCV